MMSSQEKNVFKYIEDGDIASIEKLYNENVLLLRNEEQETPLCFLLRYGNKINWNNKNVKDILTFLLNKNASKSCFVKGYLQDSLICQLPMAQQPVSSCFAWPSPIILNDIEIKKLLDESIAKYLNDLKLLYDKKKDDEAKQLDLQLNCNKDDGRNGRESDSNGSPPNSSRFDYYPKSLNVGDRVRRGVDWSYNDQDVLDDIQREGIVTGVTLSNGKPYVTISWLRNQKDPSSIFETQQYYYYPGKLSVFQVDINDRNSFPSDVKKPLNLSDGIKTGDLVTLTDGLVGSSFNNVSGFTDTCLAGASKVGVVIDKSENLKSIPNKKKDYVMKVMELRSGMVMKYAMSDLKFADGSTQGSLSLDKLPRSINILKESNTAGGSTKGFKKGDRVMLRSSAKVTNGCLHRHKSGFVGVVSTVSGSSIAVTCNDAKPGTTIAAEISGNYPNYTYQPSDLMHEFENHKFLPLMAGDIVEYNNSFYHNRKDGWCLGPINNQKKGIVMFAGSCCSNKEQRDIEISAVDNIDESFRFKSSWLRRVANDGQQHFKIGDRVRLDIGHWNSESSGGKCLGSALFGSYGLVISTGVIRDGIQRNIEVIACTGSRKGQKSFYPSYSLVFASERFAVMTDDDVTTLTHILKTTLAEASLTAIDIEKELKIRGKTIWHYLGQLPIFKDTSSLQSIFETWTSQRSMDWPIDDEPPIVYNAVVKSPTRKDSSGTWTCANPMCFTIGGYVNSSLQSKCKMCNVKAPKWECEACFALNSVQNCDCEVCGSAKNLIMITRKLFEIARTVGAPLEEFKLLFSSISNVPNIKSILLSSEDSSGNNLLVNAVDRSNIELIRYLIDELGFDGNCKVIGNTKEVNNISTNLLHLAVIRNNHECINTIVKVIDKNTLNSLYHGCEQILFQLLQHNDVDLDNLVDFSFPLAIMNGNMGVLKLFLSNHIIVEKLKAKPEQHYRFLILAAATGNSDVLKDLLDLTTVNICDTLKRDIAMEILKYTSDIYMEELSYYNILDDSSSAVTPDDTWSLLHICAVEGFTDCAKVLLERADIIRVNDTINERGWTALALCAFFDNVDIMKELLKCDDIDVNTVFTDLNKKSYTPLSLAISANSTACIQALLEHPLIDINKGNFDGSTALHTAAAKNGAETLNYLLEKHVELNIMDIDGNTPLMVAADMENLASLKILLLHPAIEVSLKNRMGWTCLDLARVHMHKECQELISSYVEEQSTLYKPESISSSLIPSTNTVKALKPSMGSHRGGRKKLIIGKKTTINDLKPAVVPFSFSVSQSDLPKPDDKSKSIISSGSPFASPFTSSSPSTFQALCPKSENTDATDKRWSCSRCTYLEDASKNVCSMCSSPKPQQPITTTTTTTTTTPDANTTPDASTIKMYTRLAC